MNLAELLAARVPRYTSYPTAPHFEATVRPETVQRWLADLPAREPISLYVHIPFCDSLCWFCGCHMSVVNGYDPVAAYVDVLLREIDRVASALGAKRSVAHLHFGGGSPTILNESDVARVMNHIRDRFDVLPRAEIAVEIDPRGLSRAAIDAWALAGVTRASLGVQDVNPRVQRAVNRIQPISVTRDAVEALRAAGVKALNVDLMYGLPFQTTDDVRRTVHEAAALAPDRVALFGYAHVPGMKRHQKLIDEAHLPDTHERLRQYQAGSDDLIACGYEQIGLDHFARPDDPLALALRRRTLARNFQGYTTDTAGALVGLGASAISAFPQGYAQNASDVPTYRSRIGAGRLAIARGRVLTEEDRARREIIEHLMCHLEVDLADVAARNGRRTDAFSAELRTLAPLVDQGLLKIEGQRIRVPNAARVAVRLVASAFDA